jgi:regulator of replication initiation timing
MSNKNEVFEYLIDQLRQQVNKKDVTSFNVSVQISDLDEVKQVVHNLQQHIAGKDDEIRALKDSLRQQVNNNQCEDLAHEVQSLKNQLRDASALVAELQKELDVANSTVARLSKEGVQRCNHVWYRYNLGGYTKMCLKCGLKK